MIQQWQCIRFLLRLLRGLPLRFDAVRAPSVSVDFLQAPTSAGCPLYGSVVLIPITNSARIWVSVLLGGLLIAIVELLPVTSRGKAGLMP